MAEKIILASGSPFRKALLVNAGVAVEAVPAEVDERALEAPLKDSGISPEDVALVLAEAKA
ncbi:MAG: septum formation inhibitor Maf, partial [Mesorhizobium sp.]